MTRRQGYPEAVNPLAVHRVGDPVAGVLAAASHRAKGRQLVGNRIP